jgi:hypothetical protein
VKANFWGIRFPFGFDRSFLFLFLRGGRFTKEMRRGLVAQLVTGYLVLELGNVTGQLPGTDVDVTRVDRVAEDRAVGRE